MVLASKRSNTPLPLWLYSLWFRCSFKLIKESSGDCPWHRQSENGSRKLGSKALRVWKWESAWMFGRLHLQMSVSTVLYAHSYIIYIYMYIYSSSIEEALIGSCKLLYNRPNKTKWICAGIPVTKELSQTNDNPNVAGDTENGIGTTNGHSKKSIPYGSTQQITTYGL